MPSTTAWSDYAAKQLKLPFGSYRNQVIRTEFFNTHYPFHQKKKGSFAATLYPRKFNA
jgi:hypothetical protein